MLKKMQMAIQSFYFLSCDIFLTLSWMSYFPFSKMDFTFLTLLAAFWYICMISPTLVYLKLTSL